MRVKPDLSAYPTITATDGSVVAVDANGLIDGRIMAGQNAGKLRRNHPCAPPDGEQIAICLAWLSTRCVAQRTPGVVSYSAKHAAEWWAGEYVSNGALIVAAERLGIRQLRCDRRYGINTLVAISKRAYVRLPEVSKRSQWRRRHDG